MNHGPRRSILLLLLAGCGSLPQVNPAQQDSQSAVGEPVYQPMLVVGLPQLQPTAPAGKPLEAMTARSTPISDVLLGMFKDSDINLLVDPAVQGTTCTFDIKHSTVEEAFESLLRSLDLGYEWDGSFLRIRNAVQRTFFIDLLSTTEAGPEGSGTTSTSGGHPAQQSDFWSEIQQVLPQVLGPNGRFVVNQSASAIHVEASPAAVERMQELVDTTMRRRNAQVSIEARLLEVRLADKHSMGVNWSLLPGLFKSGKTGLTASDGIVQQVASSGAQALTFGMLDAGDYSVFVDALQSQGQVRVLSSPHVSTMNNVPASIRVVDQIPIISREVITDQGVARSEFSVSFVEAGVTVQVTPMIGEDGQITVDVRPQITEQTGTVVTPDALIEQPILSTRSTSTVVRVADGQAIVLGGLRSTRKDEVRQGVPFLMDIPFLGQLFSSTVQNRSEVELMIVLIPRVLDSSWIDEEVRRGAHRLQSMRRPFQWNSIRMESVRPEDWSGGALQGQPFASSAPDTRTPASVPPVPAIDRGLTVTRSGLSERALQRAQQAIDAGQQRQAVVWLEQALALEPRQVDALVAAGVLSQHNGNHARARLWLDRAVALAPEDPLALTARGALELVDGSPFAAKRWFEAANARAKTPWSASNLAAAMLMAGETEAASKLLRAAVVDSAPPELFANLSFAEHAAGDQKAAVEHLQRALTAGADPRNPRIHALQRMLGLDRPAPRQR